MQEERNGHRNNRPNARRKERHETAEDTHQENIKEAAAGSRRGVAILLKLVDDGRVPFRHRSTISLRNIDSGDGSAFSVLLRCGRNGSSRIFRLSLFVGHGLCCICGSAGWAVFTCHLAFNRHRREAVLIITSTILQVSLKLVVLFREFNTLCKRTSVLKIRNRHVEDLILYVFHARSGLQFAYRLCAVGLIDTETGARGTAFADIGRVNVPALCNGGFKDDIHFSRVDPLVGYGKINLRLRRRSD